MSNTTKVEGNFIQIKGLDADWSLPGDMANLDKSGIKVKSIKFKPSAANDIMVIKEAPPGYTSTASLVTGETATAPEIFYAKCTDAYDQRIEYFGEGVTMRPFIDISDCTLGTASSARVEFVLA